MGLHAAVHVVVFVVVSGLRRDSDSFLFGLPLELVPPVVSGAVVQNKSHCIWRW